MPRTSPGLPLALRLTLVLTLAACGGPDADGDGFIDRASGGVDCDDSDASVHPGAAEQCDGVDQDCDGSIDEDAADALLWFLDNDGDGFGGLAQRSSCEVPPGYVADAGDCDDSSAATSPAATERCDGADNDCDGDVDEDAVDALETYADADGDGFGDPETATRTCAVGPGRVLDGGDCADGDPAISPAAPEACDGLDNNCDAIVDDGLRVPADMPSLQAALDAATDGARICLDPGTYAGPFDFGEVEVVVASTGSSADTFLDGEGSGPVVTIAGGQRARTGLVGVTVTGGQAVRGAGILVQDASVGLEDVVVRDTQCDEVRCEGVGIYVDGAPQPLVWRDVAFDDLACAGSTCAGTGVWAHGVDLRIRGLDVSGLTHGTTGCSMEVEGGLVHLGGEDSRMLLEDVVVEGFSIAAAEEDSACRARDLTVDGGLVKADYVQSVVLRDVDVHGLDLVHPAGGRTRRNLRIEGGAVATGMVREVVLEGLTLHEPSVSIPEDVVPSSGGSLLGGLVYVWSYDSESALTIEDLVISDAMLAAHTVRGGLLRVSDVDTQLVDVDISGLTMRAQRSLTGGLLEYRSYGNGSLDVEGLSVQDSQFESTAFNVQGAIVQGDVRGGASFSDMEISGVTVDAQGAVRGGLLELSSGAVYYEQVDLLDNVVTTSTRDVRGGLLQHRTGEARLDRVRIAGNEVEAGTVAYGLVYEESSSARWDNVILAGNTTRAIDNVVRGGGLSLGSSVFSGRNVSVHDNVVTSERRAVEGGFAYLNGSRDSYLELRDSDVSALRVEGAEVRGAVVFAAGEASAELAWCNVEEGDGAFSGVTLGEGMIDRDPGYADTTGEPSGWDLQLSSTSPLRDAGDPDRVDADGSRVDIGAHGGPGGGAW